jgi:hypothetical protein
VTRTPVSLLAALLAACASAHASEIAIGSNTIQKLVAEQLFARQGRWYLLDDGPCYAYLENPKIRLEGGRLVLDAHVSSRVGQRIGNYCAGSGFSSQVALSGRLVGQASTLTLSDIQIDHVEDGATRAVLDLIQNMAPQAMPRAFSVDVLASIRGTPINLAEYSISVQQFRIASVTTRPTAAVVVFDLALSTP